MKHNKQFNLGWSMKLSYTYIRHLAQVNHDDDSADNVFISTPIKDYKHWYLPYRFSLKKPTKNPYIRNDNTNLYLGSHLQWRKANSAVRNICETIYSPNLSHDMINGNVTRSRLVSVLVEPPKSLPNMKMVRCCDKHLRLMEAPVLTNHGYTYPAYQWFYANQGNINHAIKLSHGFRLLSSVESTQYWTRLYIHNQLLVQVPSDTNLNDFASKLGHDLGVMVSCKWLYQPDKDHADRVIASYSPSLDKFSCLSLLINKATHALKSHHLALGDKNIEAIVSMVHYLYKQKKLPVAYGSNTRARNDYLRFQHLSFKQKSIVMDGVMNSTYNHSNQIHISYKRLINETNRHLLKHYAYLLAMASIKSNVVINLHDLHWNQHVALVDWHQHLTRIADFKRLSARQHVIRHRLALVDWKLAHFNELDWTENGNLSHFSSITSNYQAIAKNKLMKQLSWAKDNINLNKNIVAQCDTKDTELGLVHATTYYHQLESKLDNLTTDYRTVASNKETSTRVDSVSDNDYKLNSLLSNMNSDSSFTCHDVHISMIGSGNDEFINFANSSDFLALRRSSGIPP